MYGKLIKVGRPWKRKMEEVEVKSKGKEEKPRVKRQRTNKSKKGKKKARKKKKSAKEKLDEMLLTSSSSLDLSSVELPSGELPSTAEKRGTKRLVHEVLSKKQKGAIMQAASGGQGVIPSKTHVTYRLLVGSWLLSWLLFIGCFVLAMDDAICGISIRIWIMLENIR